MGKGDGSFPIQQTYNVPVLGTNESLGSLVQGDFAGSGKIDLAVAINYSISYPASGSTPAYVVPVVEIWIMPNNGDGTFGPFRLVGGPFNQGSQLLVGDFEGDDKLDLALLGNGIEVLPNDGHGDFGAAVTVPADLFLNDGFYGSIVTGSFTSDGQLDFADVYASDVTSTVFVTSIFGPGTYATAEGYTLGPEGTRAVAGDFNGDGKLDLAVANDGADTVTVLLGNGDGTFTDASEAAPTSHATPLVVDTGGDGTDGVVVVDSAGNILYRAGNPNAPGSFLPPVTINPGFPSRNIAVFSTADGPVVASVDVHDPGVSLYAWRDGEFVRAGSLATGQLPAQIVAVDLNGDGSDDLVVQNAGEGTLSLFFPTSFMGPFGGSIAPLSFLPPVTLSVGLGVSDIEAIDTTGSGRLDLVVTNSLTGQVSVLLNLGGGDFAAPEPFRAGPGLIAVESGTGAPEVTSLEATAGVAAGTFTVGGLTDLVTINPGSYSLDVLAGLGGGRFANPVTIDTSSPALVVRLGDFTGNGIPDLAVLTTTGVSVYLGNGQGGFSKPLTYNVGPDSSGLTIADINRDGISDLLVGNSYGDVLVLLGNGDGTFQPYHEANQSIELAVADLTGNGSSDVIYADQGLDRVVVDYGAGSSTVLANQSTGLLDPGAVKLADLNGDGIPDLIVANSGGNDLLIYPGLGNGQFGPAVDDGRGVFTGTDPVGITVADLSGNAFPDLVVANEGSNDVSILINQGDFNFTQGPRLDAGGLGRSPPWSAISGAVPTQTFW